MKKRLPTRGSPTLFATFLFFTALISFQSSFGQEILKEFNAPGPEVRGLAWDGQYLWCSDAQHGRVYQLDPEDGHVVSFIDFDMDYQYGGLGWGIDDYLWISDYQGGQSWFFKVDPSSGAVVSSFHCPGG